MQQRVKRLIKESIKLVVERWIWDSEEVHCSLLLLACACVCVKERLGLVVFLDKSKLSKERRKERTEGLVEIPR